MVVNAEPVIAYDPDTGNLVLPWDERMRGAQSCFRPWPALRVFRADRPGDGHRSARARRRDRDPCSSALDQRRALCADALGLPAPDGARR